MGGCYPTARTSAKGATSTGGSAGFITPLSQPAILSLSREPSSPLMRNDPVDSAWRPCSVLQHDIGTSPTQIFEHGTPNLASISLRTGWTLFGTMRCVHFCAVCSAEFVGWGCLRASTLKSGAPFSHAHGYSLTVSHVSSTGGDRILLLPLLERRRTGGVPGGEARHSALYNQPRVSTRTTPCRSRFLVSSWFMNFEIDGLSPLTESRWDWRGWERARCKFLWRL
jgi:hypothetical protein